MPTGAGRLDPLFAPEETAMPVMAASTFERFFKEAAGLDVDKRDARRYVDFLNTKAAEMLTVAEANAQANGRDVIEPRDLPITHGLQVQMDEFARRLDPQVGLCAALDQLLLRPPLDLSLSDEADQRLLRLAGGVSLALARVFTVLDPKVHKPQTDEWERATRIAELLL
jgi:hypothetical protein